MKYMNIIHSNMYISGCCFFSITIDPFNINGSQKSLDQSQDAEFDGLKPVKSETSGENRKYGTVNGILKSCFHGK